MRRSAELFFTVLRVPMDFLALVGAGALAYSLRFETFAEIRPALFSLPFGNYLALVTAASAAWLLIFAMAGLYTVGGTRKKFEEFKKIFLACSTGFAGLLAILFFSREFFASRFIIIAAWALAIFLVSCGRLLIHALQSASQRYGFGVRSVIVIGADREAKALVEEFRRRPALGYRVLQVFPLFNASSEKIMAKLDIDEVILAKPETPLKEVHALIDFADEHHIPLKYSADMFATHAAELEFSTLAGIPLMEIKRTRLEGWGRVYKRIFDILGSLLLIILTSPFLILGALLTLFENGFPVIYLNERVGLRGHIFNTLKFRTMYKKYCIGKQFRGATEALQFEAKLIEERGIKEGPIYKIKNDPRITHIGRILRKLSIDELPQLFNVLRGNMSLIGPRPHQPREVEKYDKHHRKVFTIKPGITGLAQISGRSDLSFEDEFKLDSYYIERWSMKLDFIILFKTPFVVLFSRGAY
ncbi:MAG: sugar transferase [Patescibacteria group bacterium]